MSSFFAVNVFLCDVVTTGVIVVNGRGMPKNSSKNILHYTRLDFTLDIEIFLNGAHFVY